MYFGGSLLHTFVYIPRLSPHVIFHAVTIKLYCVSHHSHVCSSFLGWPPRQWSDMTLVGVSRRAYCSLCTCIRKIRLFTYSWTSCKHHMVCVLLKKLWVYMISCNQPCTVIPWLLMAWRHKRYHRAYGAYLIFAEYSGSETEGWIISGGLETGLVWVKSATVCLEMYGNTSWPQFWSFAWAIGRLCGEFVCDRWILFTKIQ